MSLTRHDSVFFKRYLERQNKESVKLYLIYNIRQFTYVLPHLLPATLTTMATKVANNTQKTSACA